MASTFARSEAVGLGEGEALAAERMTVLPSAAALAVVALSSCCRLGDTLRAVVYSDVAAAVETAVDDKALTETELLVLLLSVLP